jgi:hypothetical protein
MYKAVKIGGRHRVVNAMTGKVANDGGGYDTREEANDHAGALTSEERDALPTSSFAIPEQRKYPIHDISHARNALSRVAANGTPDEKARVRAAVKRRYPGIIQGS